MRRAMNVKVRLYLLLSLFFLLSSFNYSFAQFSISGKVFDSNGSPLPGASVIITENKQGVATNENGSYLLQQIKQGHYTLQVSFIGYESKYKRVNIEGNKKIDFWLSESQNIKEEIVVAATRAQSTTPVAVSNLSKQDLNGKNSGQDIPYILSLTPSLVSTSEAGAGVGYTSLRIRGTDPTRINVTIDGVPLNDSESQGVFWVNMPDFANSVDNIQIQRGVGTSTNGAAAFGATINFQTERINKKPFAEIASNIGSYGTFKNSAKMSTGLLNDHFTMNARYSKLESDGFVDRGFVDHESMFLSASYITEKSLIKANIIHGDQRTGITWWGNPNPEKYGRRYNPAGEYTDNDGNVAFYDNQTDNYTQTHYILHFSTQLNQLLSFNTSAHYTRGEGYYEQYKEDEDVLEYGLNPINLDGFTTSDIIRQKKLENDFYGMVFALNYNSSYFSSSLGGGLNKYDGDHFGEIIWMQHAGNTSKDYQWYLNNGEKTDFNIYAKANWKLSDLISLYGDVQFRYINYDMTGIDDDLVDLTMSHNYSFLNPKVGAFFTIDKQNSAYASFAIAHREPTRANLKEAKGDPSATPTDERLYDLEIGYQYKGTKSSLGINGYYMYYRDQLVATGEKSSVGYDIMTNVDKSYRLGVEVFGGVKLTDWLKWDANLTLSKNKIIDYIDLTYGASSEKRNTEISYSPNIVGSSIIFFSPLKRLNAQLISKYVGDQYFDNTSSNSRKIDAYFINNVRVSYDFKLLPIKNLNIFFQANNILNKEYSNNAYGGHWYEDGEEFTWAYYFPQAGTNYMTGIKLSF